MIEKVDVYAATISRPFSALQLYKIMHNLSPDLTNKTDRHDMTEKLKV
jgi:hypothetical protein